MAKFYPAGPEPESLGERINDMILAKKQMDDYERQLKMAWEASQKKDEKKEEKKSPVKFYIMLGVFSIPIMVVWNLAMVGGVIWIIRLAKTIN